MRNKRANVDALLAEFASREHAVGTTAELLALGLSRTAIARRDEGGRLHPKHRGVYAIGHRRLTRKGAWLAAVKACGPSAALSHHDAAYHSRILPLPASLGPVHVTVPGALDRARFLGLPV